MEELEHRRQVVEEARSWIGTPYLRGGRIKGGGADCASLLYFVYKSCGLVDENDEEIGHHSSDWWQHTKEEKYLLRVLRHAYKVAEAVAYYTLNPLPGNLLLSKAALSKVYNHGAIVTEWPFAVHAMDMGVEEIEIWRHPVWSHQIVTVLDPWEKKKQAEKVNVFR